MMNSSTIFLARTEISSQTVLNGNFGAMIFMVTYIGFYGLNLIIYFTYQFMSDSSNVHDDEIPNGFFSTFHQINERQEIYLQLTDKNWIKQVYQVYYSDQPTDDELIEEKVTQCSEKYHQKIEDLKSKDVYYVERQLSSSPSTPIGNVYLNNP